MTRLSPPVTIADRVVPVPESTGVRVGVSYVVVLVALAGCAVWGWLTPSPWSRAVVVSLVVSLVVFFVAGVPHLGAVRRGRVTVADLSDRVAFVPRRDRWAIVILPMVLAAVPGVIVVVAWMRGVPLPGLGVVFPAVVVILSCLAAFAAVQAIVGLRVPAGLTLTPDRLFGVRQVGRRSWTWDELGSVAAVLHRNRPALELITRGGRRVAITGALIGSDPNVVAAVVRHFRDRPQDRPALARGASALDLVP